MRSSSLLLRILAAANCACKWIVVPVLFHFGCRWNSVPWLFFSLKVKRNLCFSLFNDHEKKITFNAHAGSYITPSRSRSYILKSNFIQASGSLMYFHVHLTSSTFIYSHYFLLSGLFKLNLIPTNVRKKSITCSIVLVCFEFISTYMF